MQKIHNVPNVAVGLMTGVTELRFTLQGDYLDDDSRLFGAGSWCAVVDKTAAQIILTDEQGLSVQRTAHLTLRPVKSEQASFTLRDVVIGIDFHWQRREDQQFRGALRFRIDDTGRLLVINDVSVEDYLTSVISSEMSASAHVELLKAHAIISRSWLLAQLAPWKTDYSQTSASQVFRLLPDGSQELIRWYDRESHSEFDVCADDHCQRYQGMTKAAGTFQGKAGLAKVQEVIRATFGQVLTCADTICDARFSKSCGGMVEEFKAAWAEVEVPYLVSLYDGLNFPREYRLPLMEENHAEKWIVSSPPAFCHTSDRTILQRILPDFDQETTDFYRWQVRIGQLELQELLHRKLGVEFGTVFRLEPVVRGASGRLVKLRIVGEKATMVIGKELEIRRALSASHLYSSAFVVRTEDADDGVPVSFLLLGAGWGHGVGLCQIGAALMAEQGFTAKQILSHYYPGARNKTLYSPA